MVKVHCDEGLTNHIGPESCAAVREGVRETLTGYVQARRLSVEIWISGKPMRYLPRKANWPRSDLARIVPSRRVRDPGMYGNPPRESRETSTSAQERRARGRVAKA
jgi:hypothetical protein